MSAINSTVKYLVWGSSIEPQSPKSQPNRQYLPKLLSPIRQWLNRIEVSDRNFARRLCRFIPAQCPFARKVELCGRTLLVIPPLCKLNPFYEEVVALRFRALCYLADEWGEDISAYC